MSDKIDEAFEEFIIELQATKADPLPLWVLEKMKTTWLAAIKYAEPVLTKERVDHLVGLIELLRDYGGREGETIGQLLERLTAELTTLRTQLAEAQRERDEQAIIAARNQLTQLP